MRFNFFVVFNISVTIYVFGSTAVVCVEAEGAANVKSILRDARTALSENLSWQKQFYVVQTNLIRHIKGARRTWHAISQYGHRTY